MPSSPADAQYGRVVDGIEVERVQGATLVIVRAISDDFRTHVRDRLAEYCYGATTVSEDTEYYSFEKTVTEFLERYDPKPRKTRLGMAGELIVHVLMPLLHAELTSAAVYFNKEERSIKKGFDLTFLGSSESAIWYGEVKSGEVGSGSSADDKAAALIDIAASSLSSMLDDVSLLSRWDAALIDTRLTLELGLAKSARELLRSDSETVRKGGPITKRVLLAGAVMHEFGHCTITAVGAEKIGETIASSGQFSEAKILVIQQDALEALIDYLREVANA
jgi:hypothetical protein